MFGRELLAEEMRQAVVEGPLNEPSSCSARPGQRWQKDDILQSQHLEIFFNEIDNSCLSAGFVAVQRVEILCRDIFPSFKGS